MIIKAENKCFNTLVYRSRAVAKQTTLQCDMARLTACSPCTCCSL